MKITDFHAKYYAYLLAQKRTGHCIETIAATLQDSALDLLPHQIEAALFAFHNPLCNGVILGDEVGLGKTVEAGIVIAQKWSELKKRIIIIVPAPLRRQWQLELEEKFYLPSIIIDKKNLDQFKNENQNPFYQDKIIITSYQFASLHSSYISAISWDLAVLDEAHRIRNCYKDGNVIAKTLKESLKGSFKLLLTATPLQNSLLELFGIASFIDDVTFGDVDSFKYQYLYDRKDNDLYSEFADRIKQICIRTLRRQVLEYIRYTNRTSITQEFTPTKKEQLLYDKVSDFIQKDTYALPYGQRHLIALIIWKLLASSSYAVADTLKSLVIRLQNTVDLYNSSSQGIDSHSDKQSAELIQKKKLTKKDIENIKKEIAQLKEYVTLAESIKHNAKGDALLVALKTGFKKLKELGANQKAVIFTESRRTQEFLYEMLKDKYKDKIVLFNGETKNRQQTVKDFENNAKIMIATESASEGLNLQFCSMVINYDLPWNPQRIEQRIGRCHRYGQKFDVVVINFLNSDNVADRRVLELLTYKFQLFEGVFGASDSVLGMVEGVDFENRIVAIYNECRTVDEIEKAFEALRLELDDKIQASMKNTKQKLLENFDEDVARRLKIDLEDSKMFMDKFERMLWEIARFTLEDGYATFDDENMCFEVYREPYYRSFYGYKRVRGIYKLDKKAPLNERFRMKCALANQLIADHTIDSVCKFGEVTFDLSSHKTRLSDIESLKGKEGYLTFYNLEIIYTSGRENRLVFAGFCDDGCILTQKQMARLFDLEGVRTTGNDYGRHFPDEITQKLDDLMQVEKDNIIEEISRQNSEYFDEEVNKLEKWSNDVKLGLEKSLRELDKNISEVRALSRKPVKLEDRIAVQERLKKLEHKRNQLRMQIYDEQDQIDKQREKLINNSREKLSHKIQDTHLFTIRWKVK